MSLDLDTCHIHKIHIRVFDVTMKILLNDSMREKIMYLIFGVLTTLVSLFSYRLLTSVVLLHYLSATVISWIIAVFFAFVTNKLFVFNSDARDSKSILMEGASFFFFRLISLFLDLGIMFVMVELLGINDMAAKLFATVVIVTANYFASKFFIFKDNLE